MQVEGVVAGLVSATWQCYRALASRLGELIRASQRRHLLFPVKSESQFSKLFIPLDFYPTPLPYHCQTLPPRTSTRIDFHLLETASGQEVCQPVRQAAVKH